MRKTIPIFVLISLALLVVSCAPGEVGPGKAIAGVQQPEFVKVIQCYHKHYSIDHGLHVSNTLAKTDFFHLEDHECPGSHEVPATSNLVRQFYALKGPVPGYTTVKLGQNIRSKTITEKKTFGRRTTHVINDYMPVKNDGSTVAYLLANPIPGYTTPVYRCTKTDVYQYDIAADISTQCGGSNYALDGSASQALLGYALLKPELPKEAVEVYPPVEAPGEFRCAGKEIELDLKRGNDFRIDGVEGEYYIELIFSTVGAAKFIVSGEVTDLLKVGDSFVTQDNLVKMTLLRASSREAEFCLEKAELSCEQERERNNMLKEQIADVKKEIKDLEDKIEQRMTGGSVITGAAVAGAPAGQDIVWNQITQCEITTNPAGLQKVVVMNNPDCSGSKVIEQLGFLIRSWGTADVDTTKLMKVMECKYGYPPYYDTKYFLGECQPQHLAWGRTVPLRVSKRIGYAFKDESSGTKKAVASLPSGSRNEIITLKDEAGTFLGYWPQSKTVELPKVAAPEPAPAPAPKPIVTPPAVTEYNNLLGCRRDIGGRLAYDHYTGVDSCPEGITQRILGRAYKTEQSNTVKLLDCTSGADHLIAEGSCDPGTEYQYDLGWAYKQKPDIAGAVKINRCTFSNGEHFVIDGSCPSGTNTEASWWVLPFCKDTDTSNDPAVKGVAKSLVENKEYPDKCAGDTVLLQYACDSQSPTSGVKEIRTNCPSGQVCSDGVCKKPAEKPIAMPAPPVTIPRPAVEQCPELRKENQELLDQLQELKRKRDNLNQELAKPIEEKPSMPSCQEYKSEIQSLEQELENLEKECEKKLREIEEECREKKGEDDCRQLREERDRLRKQLENYKELTEQIKELLQK